jgi:phage shock protein PspC (stress-responsive transcriptional regulator)
MPENHEGLKHQQRRARRPIAVQPLRRTQQAFLGGVAGGVAQFIGANPLYVRILFVLALLLSFGMFGIVYLILWLFLPNTKLH